MLARAYLPLLGLLVIGAILPVRSADAQDPAFAQSSPQVRLEGQIKSVGADGHSFVLEVYNSTTPAGFRKVFSEPAPRPVRLAPVCYIFNRFDRTAFMAPGDLKEGTVIVVHAMDSGADELIAAEILIGGKVPALAKGPARGPAGGDDVEVRLPPARAGAAKFEPARGCYLGAFVMQDRNIDGRMDEWVRVVGKGHASYLRYVGYGKPFPTEWVQQVRAVGAVPNIAFEPNGGLGAVRDDAYLRNWARAAGASGGPVFLRFASEMNGTWTAYSGNPSRYRTKFRLVASVMRREAPNVAMVWTPYCFPVQPIPSYYPGDDAVDWVGVNIYSVHHHDGNIQSPADREDPAALLEPVYSRYASRKPIQISEYAATNFCLACSQSLPNFAIAKMQRMYSSLPKRFPRVKMIYWFDWDTISGGAAVNNYAVTANPAILRSYRQLTHSPYFLSRIQEKRVAKSSPERQPESHFAKSRGARLPVVLGRR